MRPAFAILGITLLTASAAVAHASSDDRSLPHRCSDTVVVATVGDGDSAPAEATGNLFGDGWFSAPLHVQKVVRGESLPAVLPVRYFAHSALVQNQEFMLVLKNTGTDYEVQAAQLMSEQPVLASRCG